MKSQNVYILRIKGKKSLLVQPFKLKVYNNDKMHMKLYSFSFTTVLYTH